jgi:hypothetical protein
METILRVGRWIADGRHHNPQEERQRTLFAVVVIHFFFAGATWLLAEGLFGDGSDDPGARFEGCPTLQDDPHHYHYHPLNLQNYKLSNLLRIHHLRLFSMITVNSIIALILLVMLTKQVRLTVVMGLWTVFIYCHAFYFALYRPHIGTEKWCLPHSIFFKFK